MVRPERFELPTFWFGARFGELSTTKWSNQFTVKLTVVLPDGTLASELLTVKAFTVTV
jgi:hypothetical protein